MMAAYRWSGVCAVATLLIGLSTASSFAFDPLWSALLHDGEFWPSGLHLSMLDLAAGNGLQLASATALDHYGTGLRLGLGYDDMVAASRNALDGSNLPLAISDRIFLLGTPCDKRFQFTLQFRW